MCISHSFQHISVQINEFARRIITFTNNCVFVCANINEPNPNTALQSRSAIKKIKQINNKVKFGYYADTRTNEEEFP